MLWHWIFHLKPTGIIGVATELIITSGIHNLHCKTQARVNLTTDGMKLRDKTRFAETCIYSSKRKLNSFPRWIPKQRNVWFGLFRQRVCSRVKFLWFESPSERSDSSTVMRVSYRDFHQIFMWSFQCFVWFCIRQGYARSFHAMTTWWLHGNFFFPSKCRRQKERKSQFRQDANILLSHLFEGSLSTQQNPQLKPGFCKAPLIESIVEQGVICNASSLIFLCKKRIINWTFIKSGKGIAIGSERDEANCRLSIHVWFRPNKEESEELNNDPISRRERASF